MTLEEWLGLNQQQPVGPAIQAAIPAPMPQFDTPPPPGGERVAPADPLAAWIRGPGKDAYGLVPTTADGARKQPLPWDSIPPPAEPAPRPPGWPAKGPNSSDVLADMKVPEDPAVPSPGAPRTTQMSGGGSGRSRGAGSYEQGVMSDLAQQQQGAERQGEALAQKAETVGAAKRDALLASQKREAEDQQFLQDTMARADAKSDALQKEITDISNTRIDNKSVFANMSTGAKIATVVSIAMGGVSQARGRGGKNEPLEIIMNMVKQNIDSQVQDLANRRAGVGMKGTLLQQDVARGMDLYNARTKATAVALETAAQIADAEGMKFDAEAMRGKTQELSAGLRMKAREEIEKVKIENRKIAVDQARIAESRRQFDISDKRNQFQFAIDKGMDLTKTATEAASRGQAARIAEMKANGQTGKDERETMVALKDVEGKPIFAPDKERATKLNDQIGAATNTIRLLSMMEEKTKAYGFELSRWTSDQVGEMTALREQFKTVYSKANAEGVVRPGDAERYEKMIGSNLGIISSIPEMSTLREATKSLIYDRAKAAVPYANPAPFDPKFEPPNADRGKPPLESDVPLEMRDMYQANGRPWANDMFTNREGYLADKQLAEEARRRQPEHDARLKKEGEAAAVERKRREKEQRDRELQDWIRGR